VVWGLWVEFVGSVGCWFDFLCLSYVLSRLVCSLCRLYVAARVAVAAGGVVERIGCGKGGHFSFPLSAGARMHKLRVIFGFLHLVCKTLGLLSLRTFFSSVKVGSGLARKLIVHR
jgi:hypothetical protein